MPPWTGWNECEVRQSKAAIETAGMAPNGSSTTLNAGSSSSTFARRSPPAPVVMGFTAINVTKSSQLHAAGITPPPSQSCGQTPATQLTGRASQLKSVASEYLGRGDEDAIVPAAAPPTRVTRGQAAKKKSAAPKKRAATTNNAPSSKRRKISEVSESMPVTKPKQTKSEAKRKSAKQVEAELLAEAAEIIPSQPVPLYSSSTSMGQLSVPSQQTSYDAVRASKGYGTTLYHSSQSPVKAPRSSMVSEPWLEAQSGKSQAESGPKLANASSIKTTAGYASTASKDIVDGVAKSNGRRMASSRTLSEDFLADGDDDFEDAMALFDTTGTTTKEKHITNAAAQPQPPSKKEKAKKSTSTKIFRQSSSILTQRPSRRESEDFMIGDDADMAAVLDVIDDRRADVLPPGSKANVSAKRKSSLKGDEARGGKAKKSNAPKKLTPVASEHTTEPENAIPEIEDDIPENTTIPLEVREVQRPQTPPARSWKLNTREVDEHEDYGGALFSEAEKKILDSLKASQGDGIKPIVRTPFPRPILDRSPLFGASSSTLLRTCFRIGEALKEGTAAIRQNNNVVLELYARVTASRREGRKQHFLFHDLYHDRPPYLEGTCELWNQTKLWELDTRSFLGAEKRAEGVMCRAIARMKRKEAADGKLKGWRLEVLSIWEARWEDIDFIAGIYGKERNVVAADDV